MPRHNRCTRLETIGLCAKVHQVLLKHGALNTEQLSNFLRPVYGDCTKAAVRHFMERGVAYGFFINTGKLQNSGTYSNSLCILWDPVQEDTKKIVSQKNQPN